MTILKRLVTLVLLCAMSWFVNAEEEEGPPMDPAYEGIHGMVLVNDKGKVYASHMPLFAKPHDAQIIYRVTPEGPHVRYLVRDADLVTIKPKKFNLERMMRGDTFDLKADVYQGHFERGGSLIYEQTTFTFEEQKYFRKVELDAIGDYRQIYDSVDLGGDHRMLIHRIRTQPSYDHLILLTENIGCITDFTTSVAVPTEPELLGRLTYCGSMKPLYFETQDFQ